MLPAGDIHDLFSTAAEEVLSFLLIYILILAAAPYFQEFLFGRR